VLEKLFPQLYTLTLTIQDAVFHPETDEFGHHTVWAHTMIAVDIGKKLSVGYKLDEEQTLALLLGALLHDIGKGITTRWEFKKGRMVVTSMYHDAHGVDMSGAFLTDLKIETRRHFPLKDMVLKLVKYHHRVFDLYKNREKITFKAIARLVRDLEEHDLLLLLLDVADRQSREPNPLNLKEPDEVVEWYMKQKEEFNITKETIQPIVMGRHLLTEGVAPGRQMGVYLNELYERQLDGDFSTLEEGLQIFRKIREKENGTAAD
jgi:tRNA nucleotidyltransferase (CCA-adding enzyme)